MGHWNNSLKFLGVLLLLEQCFPPMQPQMLHLDFYCYCFNESQLLFTKQDHGTTTQKDSQAHQLHFSKSQTQKIFLKTLNDVTTELCLTKLSYCTTFEHSHECTFKPSKPLQEILIGCCMGEVSPAALLEAVQNVLPEFVTNPKPRVQEGKSHSEKF